MADYTPLRNDRICAYIDNVKEFSSLLECRPLEFDFEPLLLEVVERLSAEFRLTCSSMLYPLVCGRCPERCGEDVIVAFLLWSLDRIPSLLVESLRSVTSN